MYVGQQDPIGLSAGKLNIYSYVDNPNGVLDPFGLGECTLEDVVAKALDDAGIANKRNIPFGPNGSIGEIDSEVSQAIIEITTKKNGKLGQITKLINNELMNPTGKPVLLYAPNYTNKAAVQAIEDAGGLVVHTLDDLISLVK